MKVTLYGKQQLWFWIPWSIFSLFIAVGSGGTLFSGNADFLVIGLFAFFVLSSVVSIKRVANIIHQPKYTEENYYRSLWEQSRGRGTSPIGDDLKEALLNHDQVSKTAENKPVDSKPPAQITPTESKSKGPNTFAVVFIGLSIVVGFTILGILMTSPRSPSGQLLSSRWTDTPMPPTNTPYPYFTPIYVVNPPTYNSGTNSGCTLWSDITLNDVGTTKCVYGTVRRTWFSEQNWTQYFTFSSDPKSIFFQKFMYSFDPALDGRCIKFTGKIYQSYDTPYMDLLPEDAIILCD